MRRASEEYEVTLRRTSRLNHAGRWVLNLLMATTPESGRWFSIWPAEAVISERRTGKQLRVIRNDSSGAEDAVAGVVEDVEEMSAEAFRKLWL